MPGKRYAIISAVATFILLGITGFLIFVVQIVALNGVIDQNKAFRSLGFGVFCQGVALLLATGFAAWFANTLIMRYDWNTTAATIAAVILGTLLGISIALVSTVLSIPLAGIH
jgi:hypothetical protein